MSQLKWHILLLTLLWMTDISESELGKRCTSSRSCSYSFTMMEEQICKDRVCRCNPEIEVRYSSDLTPRCDQTFHPSHQRVLESCYIPNNGTAMSCDINKNSICKRAKCVCFDDFFANTTSGNCEPKADYIAAHNLTEYRVRPYEYCISKSDCIDGLECHDFKCNCPEPCYYNSTAEICDCGAVELSPQEQEGVVGPAIVGILLALLIAAFWHRMIKKTIKKHTKKENASHNEVDATEETRGTYALQPVSPRSEIRGSTFPLEVPTPSGTPVKQPLPDGSDTRSGANPIVSPPPPPQASLYGFSSPQGACAFPPTGPIAPPPYSPLTPTNEPPPPYSLNAQEGSLIAPIPDSSIPAALPYPYSATTPTPSTVSPANLTGSYGATAPQLNPSPALPYPVSSGISDPVSNAPSAASAPYYELDSNNASLPRKE
ncbi:tyrosine-protein phosphatase non-receptor type 23-like isoform X2 [Macrobrachium nipponense]|uniref:tyrosine-protein phosphatase non-receptor type 23-like isoform X2 n=1 Tax=Macrobrachium nipponense TaxID=159736 RepID=UPI0030C8B449